MNKLFTAFCLMLAASLLAFAQSADDYKKAEFYGGYSNQQVDGGGDRSNFNGFEVSGVYNIRRYVGLKADVSGAYRGEDVSFGLVAGTVNNNVSFRTNSSVYNFLGGVQFKNNASESRVKPFAHALIGAGHVRTSIKNVTCSNATGTGCPNFGGDFNDTGFAGAFGGGLDIKLSDRIDFRAIQADYNPMRFDGRTSHNFRFGIGLVFK